MGDISITKSYTFVKIPASIISDSRLSLQEKGFLCLLALHSTNPKKAFSKDLLYSYSGVGKKCFQNLWKRLHQCGFITSHCYPNNQNSFHWKYDISISAPRKNTEAIVFHRSDGSVSSIKYTEEWSFPDDLSQSQFVMVSKEMLLDSNLSLGAKGLHASLTYMIRDKLFSKSFALSSSLEGEFAFNRLWRELRQHAYLYIIQKPNGSRGMSTTYFLSAIPEHAAPDIVTLSSRASLEEQNPAVVNFFEQLQGIGFVHHADGVHKRFLRVKNNSISKIIFKSKKEQNRPLDNLSNSVYFKNLTGFDNIYQLNDCFGFISIARLCMQVKAVNPNYNHELTKLYKVYVNEFIGVLDQNDSVCVYGAKISSKEMYFALQKENNNCLMSMTKDILLNIEQRLPEIRNISAYLRASIIQKMKDSISWDMIDTLHSTYLAV